MAVWRSRKKKREKYQKNEEKKNVPGIWYLVHSTVPDNNKNLVPGKRSISRTNSISFGFSDLPGAPAPLCDHGLWMFDKS